MRKKEREMKGLTWDELANLYDKEVGGRRARTKPMDSIFKWAVKRKDMFRVANDGTLHIKEGSRRKRG